MSAREVLRGALLIFCALLLIIPAVTSVSVSAEDGAGLVRCGLYYGTGALPAANLLNETGSGYAVGYYTDDAFTAVASISEEAITVLKDKNMYLAPNASYFDATPPAGSKTIGAWHVDYGYSYPGFAEAVTAAQTLTGLGFEAFPCYISGQYRVSIGNYTSKDKASAATGGFENGKATGASETCYTFVETKTGRILFEFDAGKSVFPCVMPQEASGKPVTWFKGYKYPGAFEYRRLTGADLTVVNIVGMQEYVKGVIPYEMSPSWPIEALKAQAICAKNFALTNMGKHKSQGFDLCNTVDCQVYRGLNTASENSNRAVDETDGKCLYYGEKLAKTFYHSSNGGSTEDVNNVWGGESLPYLKAVPDNFEDLTKATNGIWSYTFTKDSLTQILKAKGYAVSGIKDAYVEQFTPAGNVLKLTLVDSDGKKYSFEKEKARTILNSDALKLYTYSQRYSFGSAPGSAVIYINGSGTKADTDSGVSVIASGGEVSTIKSGIYIRSASGVSAAQAESKSEEKPASGKSEFVISGRGWGHNVGMSQWGARGMAEKDYSYDQILKYYFTGVELR